MIFFLLIFFLLRSLSFEISFSRFSFFVHIFMHIFWAEIGGVCCLEIIEMEIEVGIEVGIETLLEQDVFKKCLGWNCFWFRCLLLFPYSARVCPVRYALRLLSPSFGLSGRGQHARLKCQAPQQTMRKNALTEETKAGPPAQ